MTNALERIANRSILERRLAQAKQVQATNQSRPLLTFNKDGEWCLGTEKIIVSGQIAVLDQVTLAQGVIAFYDGGCDSYKVELGMDNPYLIGGTPNLENLPSLEGKFNGRDSSGNPLPAKWVTAAWVEGVLISGDTPGAEFVYSPASKGGLAAFGRLAVACAYRLEDEDGLDYPQPVVHLGFFCYYHKTHGSIIYNPLLTICQWVDEVAHDVNINEGCVQSAIRSAYGDTLKAYKDAYARKGSTPRNFDPEGDVQHRMCNDFMPIEAFEVPVQKATVVAKEDDDVQDAEIVQEAELPKKRTRRAKSIN